MKAKKLLSLLLLIVMTMAMFVPVQAATDSGKIGDNVTWTYDLSTKTITLSGSGATYDYQLDKNDYKTDSPLEAYCFTAKKFVVEEGVTQLGKYIFYASTRSEIHIPKSVAKIDGTAFGTIYDFDNTHVYYAGTEAEWNALDRDSDFYFEEAIMHYGAASDSSNVSSAPVTSTPQTSTATTTKATQTAPSSNAIKVYIDNKIVSFDVQPQLIGGRTMVPLRAIFEGLGATVEWDNNTQTVTAYNEVKIVKATIGSNTMTVNGANRTMDVAPMLVGGRTLVPARFVAEAFDCDVQWDGNTKTVSITTKPIDYSKVEQDISVTTPSTTTPSTTTPSVQKPATQESAQETTKSDKPYIVETLCNSNTNDLHGINGSSTFGNDEIFWYSGKDRSIIYVMDVNTGESRVYCDLNDIRLNYEDDTWTIDFYNQLAFNGKNNSLIICNADLAKKNLLSGKEEKLSGNYVVDVTNKKVLFNAKKHVMGVYPDGGVLVLKDTGSWCWGEKYIYPKYNEKEEDVINVKSLNAVEWGIYEVEGKNYMLTSDGILKERSNGDFMELVVERYGNAMGCNSKNFFMINDTTVFKLDANGEIVESYSLEDIENFDIYTEMTPQLFVAEDESIIFYDEEEKCYKKISKNN